MLGNKNKSSMEDQQSEIKLTVYTLKLDEKGAPRAEDKLIRLPPIASKDEGKGYGFRFIVDYCTEAAYETTLNTNYPLDDSKFERTKFHSKKFSEKYGRDSYFDLQVTKSGIFEYYVEYIKEDKRVKASKGYFIIDPSLEVKGNPLPLDGINLLSIVPKWLGPISDWAPHFKAASQLNYNLIHFVPLQQRGGSNSPYSIKNQLTLSDDLFSTTTTESNKLEVLKKTLQSLRSKDGLLSLIDMVWNHTSFDSEWLWDHPEAGYNVENSPHLRPAYELDTALLELSTQLQSKYNLSGNLRSEQDLHDIMNVIRHQVLPELKLYEYYAIDVKQSVQTLRQKVQDNQVDENQEPCIEYNDIRNFSNYDLSLRLIEHTLIEAHGVRLGRQLDINKIVPILRVRLGNRSVKDNLDEAAHVYHDLLNMVNLPSYKKYDDDIKAIIDNVTNHLRFQRLAENGPRYSTVSAEVPLLQTYFTRLPKNARTSKHHPDSLALANNGWVWASDPKVDFASPKSSAYLRRDVIIWGDCTKLRYGNKPEDNPFLWEHMKQYTEQMAQLFDGFRIDNCHSTPIHLAEYLLDAARRINPNLYVVAELFTGSEEKDKQFVCRLGINSLIREAMQAGDPHELSRLVHRYGGVPVGSLDDNWKAGKGTFQLEGRSNPCRLIPVVGSVTHSLFMDCTHDNETPTQKRTTIDALPNAALVAMTYCAVGSVKGYDEAYPKLLELVGESRRYKIQDDATKVGLGAAKLQLLQLHYQLCLDGYKEVHVHHENQFVMVHRQHPLSHQGYLLIAHTAYNGSNEYSHLDPVKLRGTEVEFLSSYKLRLNQKVDANSDHSTEYLQGLDTTLETLEAPQFVPGSDHIGKYLEVKLPSTFTRGSILLLKTKLHGVDRSLTSQIGVGSDAAVKDLNLADMNVLLYRSDAEEKDVIGHKHGAYHVPNVGTLAYCGLQGFISVLKPIMEHNDLGHPMCNHLRQGRWALEYTINRLKLYLPTYPNLIKVIEWLQSQLALLSKLPSFLFPKYFAVLLFSIYKSATTLIGTKAQPFVDVDNEFTLSLALCAVQLNGSVKSTGLHPSDLTASLAAGLPHFATQHMRCWGRDTFIALRGLFLCTGNYEAAKSLIIAFAGTLKHGLIPNLLDSQRRPRYNARDATWWFLQSVQNYVTIVPEGIHILDVDVPRRFPDGDTFVEYDDPNTFTTSTKLSDIIQEILQRHAYGIKFREWNAGSNLDNHMSHQGFEVDIRLDTSTGFLHGGNLHNCGTWMDKMGESHKAGTMGKPATPRDGAPIEITGLLKSTLRWLTHLHQQNQFKHGGVRLSNGQTLLYVDWDRLIQHNFENHYYVPTLDEHFDGTNNIDVNLVHRRGIYKDVVGSQIPYTDYQLRPNFPVAMVVAPELFNHQRAQKALDNAEKYLLAPLGMKTLDLNDANYRGNYDNSNDSHDYSVAKGFNYHQGPEWGWPLGYFLRAKYHFFKTGDSKHDHLLLHTIHTRLTRSKQILQSSPYAGIPELTNENGSFCRDSCTTQAWSNSCIIDLIYDLQQNTRPLIQEDNVKEEVNGTKVKHSKGKGKVCNQIESIAAFNSAANIELEDDQKSNSTISTPKTKTSTATTNGGKGKRV